MRAAAAAPFAREPLAARWRMRAAAPGEPAPPDGAGGWIEVREPGTVAACLRDAGLWSLDGPPRDFDAEDWWFEARFDAAPEGLDTLCFDGLATLAQVSLNGTPLLDSGSMFLAHCVPVRDHLKPRDNLLTMRFAALAPELARRRPRPRWRTPMVAHQQLRWLRTTLLGRTPGWSPPVAPVGPWRDIAWSSDGRHRLLSGLDGARGWCELHVEAPEGWHKDLESAELVLVDPRGREHAALLSASAGGATARLAIDEPALWWPHTHGEPVLYRAQLRVQGRDGSRADVQLGRVGFRSVTIDQGDGGFALRVNGERVFCRGGGWTPLDPASLRSTREQCRQALEQLRDAGANMLRLAGTLVEEEPHFYELCDELGLLVWQDFGFASMDYPFGDAAFAALAEREVREQAQRLGSHACVAVLCGNSEVEQQAAMWGVPREQWRMPFFDDVAARLCKEFAPGAAYWPSSAHGGAFPHVADAGTTSYYGVGAYERPLADARRSNLRFATECLAFACIPDDAALARMPGGLATRAHHPAWKSRSPRDLGAGWDFDDVRDHYVRELFGEDPMRLRHADHDRYMALGRCAVAEVMGAAYAEWRRAGSACGGALLLQLRDFWAGAGWGVLDETGAPKSAFHALRRAWAPLAVVVTDEGGNGLVAHVINDGAQPLDARLALEAWRDGDVRIADGGKALRLSARTATAVPLLDLLDHFMDLNHAWRFGPAACELVRVRLLDRDGRELARAVHFPLGIGGLAAARRRDLGLEASLQRIDDAHAQLSIRTREWAVGVHVDIPGWRANDDHFHLVPGESHAVPLERVAPSADLAGQVQALNLAGSLPLEAA